MPRLCRQNWQFLEFFVILLDKCQELTTGGLKVCKSRVFDIDIGSVHVMAGVLNRSGQQRNVPHRAKGD
jgi:hypothetical protein